MDKIVPIYYISLDYYEQSNPTESRMRGPDRVSDGEIVSTFGRGLIIRCNGRIILRITGSGHSIDHQLLPPPGDETVYYGIVMEI